MFYKEEKKAMEEMRKSEKMSVTDKEVWDNETLRVIEELDRKPSKNGKRIVIELRTTAGVKKLITMAKNGMLKNFTEIKRYDNLFIMEQRKEGQLPMIRYEEK